MSLWLFLWGSVGLDWYRLLLTLLFNKLLIPLCSGVFWPHGFQPGGCWTERSIRVVVFPHYDCMLQCDDIYGYFAEVLNGYPAQSTAGFGKIADCAIDID